MENPRLMNMTVHKMATSSNGISNTERDPVPPNPSSDSQDTTHPINPSNGFVNTNIPNLIRPPLPPPHLPLPPAGTGTVNAVPQTSSSTAIIGASSRSSGARSSSRSSHRRSGKKGTASGSSTRSKSSTSSGSGLRPKACRLCGQPHSTHEPHLYNYK